LKDELQAHIKLMKKEKVAPIIFDTYIAVIKNGVGSKIFRNFYAEINNKKTDITENGNLSCAWFVSSLLYLFKLIRSTHVTVTGTVKDLENSGWKKIDKPKIGSVLVWEEIDYGNKDFHKHIGFYIGNQMAISNSSKLGYPIKHNWTFGKKKGKQVRKIESIFWNNKLN